MYLQNSLHGMASSPLNKMSTGSLTEAPAVGTLENGYVRNVPLPRIPQIQSTNQVASVLIYKTYKYLLLENSMDSYIQQATMLARGFWYDTNCPFLPLAG